MIVFLGTGVLGWTLQPATRAHAPQRWFSAPSDVELEPETGAVAETTVVQMTDDLKMDLLKLAAGTAKGEAATSEEKDVARGIISSLETMNPTERPAENAEGTWELVFSDTQLFRSSPFFMAGRAVCEEGSQAQQYDWFCDMHRAALAISQIMRVRQVVSSTRLISEFEVSVGSVPFVDQVPFLNLAYSGGLPLTVTGSIVSSADILSKEGDTWTLLMDTVEIKGSNIPGLRTFLDNGVRLESRSLGNFLEDTVSGYKNPNPVFTTTYLDEDFRVSRDQDGKLFVYSKVSSATYPKDYSEAAADLGLGKLFDGLQQTFAAV